MSPYSPQQPQFLAADQNPQDPQFSSQDHFFGALLRLLFLRIAEELSPQELEHFLRWNSTTPARSNFYTPIMKPVIRAYWKNTAMVVSKPRLPRQMRSLPGCRPARLTTRWK
jgi:hypothetical protein